ncbi:MAG: hypothetical protein ACXWVX_07070 [Sulfuricurvum sp.]
MAKFTDFVKRLWCLWYSPRRYSYRRIIDSLRVATAAVAIAAMRL